ncbi:MAG: hypothetical protein IPK00_27315 [Deltaproteobacteria bacterium]|nr:hypothetical protein [Deltaproteobacteria bacterium]
MFHRSGSRRPSRSGLGLRTSVLGVLALALAAPASAQLVGGGNAFLRKDTNVVVQELSRHLPASGVRKQTRYLGNFRWETIQTLSVLAETRTGLSSRYWKSDTRSWSPWVHHGNPLGAPIQRISGSGDSPGIDTGLTLVPGYAASGEDWSAYQGVGLPTTVPGIEVDFKTGIHQIDPVARTLVAGQNFPGFPTVISPTLPANYRHFNPQTALTSPSPQGSGRLVRRVFGTGVPRGYVKSARFEGAGIPLVELRRDHDSQFPQWIDHGWPFETTGVAVGPGGAASIIHNYLAGATPMDRVEQRYVFVATNPSDDGYGEGLNGEWIKYRLGNEIQGHYWNDLGSAGGLVYGTPLAIPYYTNIPASGGLGRLVVFAVASTSNGFVLKSRYHDGNGWDGQWQHWGAPPVLGGDKFKLTSSVVYWDGTPNVLANLRISAFGYSEENTSAGRVGKLVEFHWDGASWRFAAPRTAPDGKSFRTSHASVIEQGNTDRIVVVGRTSTGRIYEFSREVSNGQLLSENWADLSWEDVTLTRAGL